MSATLNSKIAFTETYTFDDVLLVPNYSEFLRDEVNLEVLLHPKIKLNLPIVSSPMDTVSLSPMAISLAQRGGLGFIHRNLSIQDQMNEVVNVKNASLSGEGKDATDENGKLIVGAAVGIGGDLQERLQGLIEVGANIILVDSANGNTKGIIDVVKFIKANYQIPVMAGNICTYEGAKNLIEAGSDSLRVGMGPGSICTTRIVTGIGMPQLTALSEVCRAVKESGQNVTVVADGGIKQIGDVSKALGFGADCAMLGSMLAGFDESPGNLIENNGQRFKSYRGMGSVGAMKAGSNARYGQGPDPKKMVAEGVEGLVKYKGEVGHFLNQVEGGLRSSLFYTGFQNIAEFQSGAKFVKISNAGLKESHPHDIFLIDAGASYFG